MSTQADTPHFVWVAGLGGKLEGQKWASLNNAIFKSSTDKIVASHPIGEGMFVELSIDQLAKLYPPPTRH